MTYRNDARRHAYTCAQLECCTTAEHMARALDCSLDVARDQLNSLIDAGHFRQLRAPNFGNKLIYQPTAKAAGLTGAQVPKFLRSGLPVDARLRGLLRGFICFDRHRDLWFLPAAAHAKLCDALHIPTQGHARPLIGIDGGHRHIYVPVLASQTLFAAAESAYSRWFPLLERGTSTLHFVAFPEVATTLRAALGGNKESDGWRDAISAELSRIDQEIASDGSSLAALRLAGRRQALLAELDADPVALAPDFPGIGSVIEAVL